MQQPELSITISASGGVDHLSRLLASLAEERPGDGIEVLVGCPVPQPHNLPAFPGLRLRWVCVPTGNLSSLRNSLYELARGRFVYFLDEDCALPKNSLAPLMAWLKGAELSAYGGPYRSPSRASVYQRTYNSLANLWLEAHRQESWPLPLAGNFLVPKLDHQVADFPFAVEHPFGGEEIALCRNLAAQGLRVEIRPDLAVLHFWSGGAYRFFSRARLHGCSPSRAIRLKDSLRIFVKHYWRERSLRVAILAGLYMIVVRLMRRPLTESEYVYELSKESARLSRYASL